MIINYKRNIKLKIAYNGTKYHGWQAQENANTIQSEVEKAIWKLTKEEVKIFGSGRTDAGVHALGQIANFYTDSTIPSDRFSYALNSLLPEDIVVVESECVEDSFHARFNARGKIYRYIIYNERQRSPFYKDLAWHVPMSLDIGLMEKAASFLEGTHDFRAFCAAGTGVKDFVRTIYGITISKQRDCIEIVVRGNGFFYNMVRIISGTLIEVGTKKYVPEYIVDILNSRDRRLAGITAPSHGLYLVEVLY